LRELRQDRPPQYLEAGAIYVMKTRAFLKNKNRFFGKISIYIMPSARVFEMDDPIDLSISDIIASNLN